MNFQTYLKQLEMESLNWEIFLEEWTLQSMKKKQEVLSYFLVILMTST